MCVNIMHTHSGGGGQDGVTPLEEEIEKQGSGNSVEGGVGESQGSGCTRCKFQQWRWQKRRSKAQDQGAPPVDPSVCGFRDREKWNLPGQQFHAGVESWDELGPPDRGGGREDDHAVQTLHLLPGFEQRARVPSLDSLQLWGLGPHWWVGGSGPLRGAGPFS